MAKAWMRKERTLASEDLDPSLILKITTRVLSTRYPAYSVKGGVFDALTATNGRMHGISNEEVYASMDLFAASEGVDIVPAAGVSLAALQQAVRDGQVRPDEFILLNITGGGEKRLDPGKKVPCIEPKLVSKNITEKEIEEILCPVLKRT
ncbi:MAG TPA: cysteate synthase, partial [Nitrospirota bacterium]|nr:cysteate synthase [Nitrospirota bacterium]